MSEESLKYSIFLKKQRWLTCMGFKGDPRAMCALLEAGMGTSPSYKGVFPEHKHTFLLLNLLITVNSKNASMPLDSTPFLSVRFLCSFSQETL